ncbi:MAG: hypothetical protein H0T87_03035 [Gammaproteobacteria bacterium]|nr:hypothetical protein [Gammaproteobacteria bacterium]
MSFAIVAAGVGAAGSIAGAAMQSGGAAEASGTMQGASLASRRMYENAQRENDAMLREAERRGIKDFKPYGRLGEQATRGLSRYMGYVPEYGVPKPTKMSGAELRTQWEKKHPGMKPKAGFEARALKEQTNKLAEWETGRAAHETQQRGAEDFGEYFKPYDVEEPKYVPYKDYEQFTQNHLDADPLYKTELDENVRAWDQSAASRGSLMSGNTVAGLREITAAGIGRGRQRHIEDYEQNRGNYLEDYGIGHDEWEGGYQRDWNQDERKYNALLGQQGIGLQVADRRSGLRTGTARDRIQNSQWGTQGASGADMAAADALASGQLSQGNAYGNAFNQVGQMGMLYGLGAFDERGGGYGDPQNNYDDYLALRKKQWKY